MKHYNKEFEMQRVVVITGASSGIGLECVKQFLKLDDLQVLAIARNISSLNTIENSSLLIKQCDVQDINKLRSIVDELEDKSCKIDCLINNAGVAFNGDFTAISHDKNENMIDVNVKGLTNVLELVIPHMRKNFQGKVINLSSLADRHPRPNTAVYAATKAYVRSVSESLRQQNAKFNIRVSSISPGMVATPLAAKLRGPDVDAIDVESFVAILKIIYLQPQNICIRDLVVAPTSYEG